MNDKCRMSAEERQLLNQERLLVQMASAISVRMRELGMSRKELADRLNVSKGRVTQYLCGERNLTLRTLADIFTALETRVRISLDQPKEQQPNLEAKPLEVMWLPFESSCDQVIRVPTIPRYQNRELGSGNDDSMSLAS